jgi:hypothetical protein
VRDAAEKELNAQFAFVGASTTEKPFTIKIVPRGQLPEVLDFSESVVSVIKSDAKAYVQNAFETQEKAIQDFLTAQNVRTPRATTERAAHDPSALGSGGRSTRIVQGRALHVAAGAVALDGVIDGFLENVDSFVSNKLEKAPGRGRDINKWPVDISSGPSHWKPQEMLGEALGRVIAHEARHEYILQHAETGLGQDAPFPTARKRPRISRRRTRRRFWRGSRSARRAGFGPTGARLSAKRTR